MGVTCPKKRLSSWKNLVKIQGEDLSYFLWNEHSGNVPEKYYQKQEAQHQKQTASKIPIKQQRGFVADTPANPA